MIAEMNRQTEYGKMGKTDINILHEMTDNGNVFFAHSVQDGLDWAKSFPLFASAEVYDLADGRFVINSPWQPYDNPFEPILDEAFQFHKGAEYSRVSITIFPRNTIFESVGFERYHPDN